ncbi:MAG: aldehyde dehydrogenase family protein, partial [Candidatus Thermoplasmatota archaeon]|nr:aldehyde dehydrogenase family protein [Candidatus Thermoplasmatota archaeon]
MEINESKISMMVDDITRKVKMELKYGQAISGGPMGGGSTGIYKTIDECIRHAGIAQKKLIELSFEKRAELIGSMRTMILRNADPLAKLAVEETRLGRYPDKIKKNILAAKKAPGCEDLITEARTGDDGLVLYEYGPYGVIGSVTPTTNPTSTITSNSLGMIAAGNSVVFNPHPRAKKVSLETIKLLNRAI